MSGNSNNNNRNHKKKRCCKDAVYIQPCDLPYTIEASGTYRLCGDLAFESTGPEYAAITVNADHVVLDLGDFQMLQLNKETVLGTAIKVNANYSDVEIFNGRIHDVNGSAIYVVGPNSDLWLHDLEISNVGSDVRNALQQAGDGGIYCGDFATPMSQMKIDHVHVTHTKNYGIILFMLEDLTVQDCVIEDIYATVPTSRVFGFGVASGATVSAVLPRGKNMTVRNVIVQNVHCDFLTVPIPTSFLSGGFVFGVNNMTMEDCHFTGSKGRGAPGSGPNFVNNWLQGGIVNARITNCSFRGTESVGPAVTTENFHSSANTFVYGLAETRDITISNCSFVGAHADNGLAANIEADYGQNWLIENCQCMDVLVREVGVAFGIFSITGRSIIPAIDNEKDNSIGNMSNVLLKNTLVQGIRVLGRTWVPADGPFAVNNGNAFGVAYVTFFVNKYKESGFAEGTPADPVIVRNIQYVDCKVDDVSSVYGTATGVFVDRNLIYKAPQPLGIALLGPNNPTPPPVIRYIPYKLPEDLKDVVLRDCIVSNCTTGGPTPATAVVLSAVSNPIVDNCIINDCARGVFLTGGDAPVGYFFPGQPFVLDPIPAEFTVVGLTKDGLVHENRVNAATTVAYVDSAVGNNNFVDNIASNSTLDQLNVANWVANGNHTFA